MVQLQTQVQNLQDSVARLQQSNDERMGVLKDLVQQTADSVNKMSVAVGTLQQQMHAQQEASGGKLDQVSGQVQSLNDSVDEVKARLNAMQKALESVQGQQQSINATLQNLQPQNPSNPPGAGGPDQNNQPGAALPAQPGAQPGPGQPMANSKPSPEVSFPTTQGPYANSSPLPPAQTAPSGAPVGDLYNTALRDYIAAKYAIALTEFNEVIRTSPGDQLAGNSWYYLGEIDYREGKYAAAIKDYDHVLDQYPANQKLPVSHLHKGQALLAVKDRDAAIAEFRALVQRFPNSAEAVQARSKLNGMGVPVAPRRPS